MDTNKDKYNLRGVSADKKEVHQAIQYLDKGLYPYAFCKILPDLTGGDPSYCNIMHADTAGTKTSLAYLNWKETGDINVWSGIVQDAIVMNVDDMACVGCTDQIVISSTIGRNKNLITGAVISQIINGTASFLNQLNQLGIGITLAGGETADVGDVVRTIDVGFTTFARMKRADLIVNDIQAGDVIVGLASFGQSTYESTYNSGIGSNGLTSARHDVLNSYYKTNFPESFDPNTPEEVVYIGKRRLGDSISIQGNTYLVSDLLLAPTRTYLPVVKSLLGKIKEHIHGMIHCTGGGQTKVSKFIQQKRVVKNNLFPTPPVFELIQTETHTNWQEMYQVFNMGHRLEVYLPKEYAATVISVANDFGIEAQIVGHVEAAEKNEVVVDTSNGVFSYKAD